MIFGGFLINESTRKPTKEEKHIRYYLISYISYLISHSAGSLSVKGWN